MRTRNMIDIYKSHEVLNLDQLSQFQNRLCKGKCSQFRATKPSDGSRYAAGQFRCQVCGIYLTEEGVVDNIRCKCCNFRVRSKPRNSLYKEKYHDAQRDDNELQLTSESKDENSQKENQTKNDLEEQENEIVRKSTPIYEELDDSVKTYYEFKEFLETKMRLESNYQLVMLKELLDYGKLHKGQIAESLAYFNNKDSSDINSVKYYLDALVYDLLLNHGFVTIDYDFNNIPYYTLNVKSLEYFQKLQLVEYFRESIVKYNHEHNIPDNEYPGANNTGNIDWDDPINEKLLISKKPQNITTNPNSVLHKSLWIWSVTPVNWEILKIKNVWGSIKAKERISQVVKPGDQVAFYVIGTNSFKGVYVFDGDWYDSPGKTWDDDIEPNGELRYKSQIQIIPICHGDAKLSVLYEKLELFKNKPNNICNLILKGADGYPSNNQQPLTEDDFRIIIDELENNHQKDYVKTERELKEESSGSRWMKKLLGISSGTTTKKQIDDSSLIGQDSKTIGKEKIVAKECPRCHLIISGISNSIDFNKVIEEKFGFRQLDPNNDESKIPQSYCRKCRSQNITEENQENEIPSQSKSPNLKLLKIFDSHDRSISIKYCNVVSTEIIQKDQRLTNDDIVRIFGVGNMGGIRYSSKNNVIVLCDTQSGHYDDTIDEDFQIIYYTGEGQKGDQTLTAGNQRVIDSETTPMFYFIEVPQDPGQRKRGALDNIYRFVGRVKYTKHTFKTDNDIDGVPRQVIKFLLEVQK